MTTGFSLAKEDMGEGVALPVGDLQIIESAFVAWNFDGKAPMSIYLKWVFMGQDGLPTQAQYYRVGDTQKWGVSPDNQHLVPVDNEQKLSKNSGCGQALGALADIGFPANLLQQGNASNFVGVFARFKAEKRLSQAQDEVQEGGRGPGMLSIPHMLHSLQQGQTAQAPVAAAPGAPAVAAPVAAVAQAPVASPVAPVAPAAAPAVAPVAEVAPVAPVAAVPPVAAVAPVSPVAAVAPVAEAAPAAPVAAVAPVAAAPSTPPAAAPPSQELINAGLEILATFIANKPSVKRAEVSTEIFSNALYAEGGAARRNDLAALIHTPAFAEALVAAGYALNGDVITVAVAAAATPAPAPAAAPVAPLA